MGYMIALGNCFGCGALMSFNPDRVPSIRVRGVRQPICKLCVERANPDREKNGLAPIVPMPGAYEPEPDGV